MGIEVAWYPLPPPPNLCFVEDTYDFRRKIPETKELKVKYDGIRT
jgi:hypothetical protein